MPNAVPSKESHKQQLGEMRGKVESVRAEEEALHTQLDGELSQLIKSAQLSLDPVSQNYSSLYQ